MALDRFAKTAGFDSWHEASVYINTGHKVIGIGPRSINSNIDESKFNSELDSYGYKATFLNSGLVVVYN